MRKKTKTQARKAISLLAIFSCLVLFFAPIGGIEKVEASSNLIDLGDENNSKRIGSASIYNDDTGYTGIGYLKISNSVTPSGFIVQAPYDFDSIVINYLVNISDTYTYRVENDNLTLATNTSMNHKFWQKDNWETGVISEYGSSGQYFHFSNETIFNTSGDISIDWLMFNRDPTVSNTEFNIVEGTSSGTVVGNLGATDLDGDTLTYEIDEWYEMDYGTPPINVNSNGDVIVNDISAYSVGDSRNINYLIYVKDGNGGRISPTIKVNIVAPPPTITIGTDGITEPTGGKDDSFINKLENETGFTIDAKFTDATADTGNIYLVPNGTYNSESELQAVDVATVSASTNNTDYDLNVSANSLTDNTQYDLYAVSTEGVLSSPVKAFDTDFTINVTSSGTGDFVSDISLEEETSVNDTTYGDDNGRVYVSNGELTTTDGESFKVERFFDFLPNGEVTPSTIESTTADVSPVFDNGSFNASYSGDLLNGLDSYGTGDSGKTGYIFTNQNYNTYIRFVDEAGNKTVWYYINKDEQNSAPTGITLDSNAVDEGTGTNITVGTLTTTDSDTDDNHTYTLVAGDGDTDNASFDISGSDLVVKNLSSLTGGQTYSVRIQTDDGTDVYSKSFTITVNLIGDGNGDGVLTPADSLLIFQHINGKTNLSPEVLTALNVNGDSVVDSQDAQLIMKKYLGIISTFAN